MPDLNWTKRGLFLSPGDAPAWRRGHCGMVSALPMDDDTLRVFMTGSATGRPFVVGWLDLDARTLAVKQEPSDNPVLPLGAMGTFDCRGMCMPMVVRISDSVLYMYYVGWAASDPAIFTNGCGLAISDDNGVTWRKWSRAPLALLDDRDPIGIGTVFVLREADDHFRMWYTTFREWLEVEPGRYRHYYHIKYAESDDGIHWRKPAENIAVDFVGEEYAVARPMVVRDENAPAASRYHMWFCTRSVGSTYRIGYCESPDGITWERSRCNVQPSDEGWDSEMVEYAFVVPQRDRFVMLYNGNGYGASGTGWATAPR